MSPFEIYRKPLECLIQNKKNFTYYILLQLNDFLCLEEWAPQLNLLAQNKDFLILFSIIVHHAGSGPTLRCGDGH